MKFNFGILIAVAIFSCGQIKKATQNLTSSKNDTVIIYQPFTQSLPLSSLTDSLLAESINSNHQIISTFSKQKQKDNWDKAAIIIQVIALGSLILGFIVYIQERRKSDMEFMSSINRMKIDHPELHQFNHPQEKSYQNSQNCISGKVLLKSPFHFRVKGPCKIILLQKSNIKINGTSQSVQQNNDYSADNNSSILLESIDNSDLYIDIEKSAGLVFYSKQPEEIEIKIRAYSYYILNNFESVLKGPSYKGFQLGFGHGFRRGWINYFKALYKQSPVFKNIVDNAIDDDDLKEQFTKSFINKLNRFRTELKNDTN